MDEKQPFEEMPSVPGPFRSSRDEESLPRRRPSSVSYRDRTIQRICIGICIVIAACTLSRSLLRPLIHPVEFKPQPICGNCSPPFVGENHMRKVALEAHIMSKCPDARACLQELVVPAMENVSDKVDFGLSFIGSLDPDSDAVTCMHGPSECLGNMILLCAAQLYPDPKLSLGFANCMIDDYHDIPQRDLVESCAMEHSLDFKKINGCISEEGKAQGLLWDSVERSTKANVSTSCTIRLQGKTWCVTDEKKDCNDGSNLDGLVKDVNEAYEELNS